MKTVIVAAVAVLSFASASNAAATFIQDVGGANDISTVNDYISDNNLEFVTGFEDGTTTWVGGEAFGGNISTRSDVTAPGSTNYGINSFKDKGGTITFTFDQAITGFGVWISDIGDIVDEQTLGFSIDGGSLTTIFTQTAQDGRPKSGIENFFGYTGNTAFTSIAFTQSNINDGIGYDVVYQNAVPEPSTWLMMLAGFAVTGAALRRRKPVAAAA